VLQIDVMRIHFSGDILIVHWAGFARLRRAKLAGVGGQGSGVGVVFAHFAHRSDWVRWAGSFPNLLL
jgi:hypothetical protein